MLSGTPFSRPFDNATDFATHLREQFDVIDATIRSNVWTTLGSTVLLVVFICWSYVDYKLRGPIYLRWQDMFWHWIKRIPIYVKGRVARDMAEAKAEIQGMVHKRDTAGDWLRALPETGLSRLDILADAERYSTRENGGVNKRQKPNYLKGAMSGACFNLEQDSEEMKLNKAMFGLAAYSNPLWPAAFPEIRRMEAEVVAMTNELMNAPPGACGTMTAGGSMSILQACHAYRTYAYNRGVNFPEMILPSSAHAAFYKAADLFRIKVVEIKVEKTGFVVDPKKVEKAINSSTCMIVGSVPNYPYGTTDPIEALGKIAKKYKVPLHVDACCGGFLVPFFDQSDVPRFDFRVEGVSSISADTHKYGLAPKGSSVILFRDPEMRAAGFYQNVDWSGGIYASPTLEGSRNGSAIAVTWASLLFHGKSAFRESAATVRRVTRELRERIRKLPYMELMGEGDICIVAWRNTRVSDFKLVDILEESGYYLSPLQFPVGAHIMVTPLHGAEGFVDGLVGAMEAGIKKLLSDPDQKTGGAAAMYGMTVNLPDRKLVADVANLYLEQLYEFPPNSSIKPAPADPQEAIDEERALELFDDLRDQAVGLSLVPRAKKAKSVTNSKAALISHQDEINANDEKTALLIEQPKTRGA